MRAFVFADARSTKAILLLDCLKFTANEARLPGHVNLAGLEPGMVVRPAGEGTNRPDRARAYVVESVEPRKGEQVIKFERPGGQPELEPVTET